MLLQGGEDLGIVISWQKEVLDLGENNLGEAAKSFEWKVPSRWKVKGEKDDVEARGMNAKIVDHVVIG